MNTNRYPKVPNPRPSHDGIITTEFGHHARYGENLNLEIPAIQFARFQAGSLPELSGINLHPSVYFNMPASAIMWEEIEGNLEAQRQLHANAQCDTLVLSGTEFRFCADKDGKKTILGSTFLVLTWLKTWLREGKIVPCQRFFSRMERTDIPFSEPFAVPLLYNLKRC